MPTLCRTLQCLDLTHKVVSACALEWDDLVWLAFMNHIADEVPDPHMMMFIDEAVRNQRSSQWPKGWALLGRRCIQKCFFVHGECYSTLPVLTLDGLITYDIIPESVTTEHFIEFLCELVVSLTVSPVQNHH